MLQDNLIQDNLEYLLDYFNKLSIYLSDDKPCNLFKHHLDKDIVKQCNLDWDVDTFNSQIDVNAKNYLEQAIPAFKNILYDILLP